MADLIYGIPIDCFDGVNRTATDGIDYANAELRVNTGLQVGVFGELATAEATPIIQEHFVYGQPVDWQTFTATGGSVTFTDNFTTCQTGTSIGGYGVSRTEQALIYRAGQSSEFKLTAIFDSANAVANSRQTAGAFNLTDGIHFGYNGTQFGVLFETYGKAEIQTLTVTAGASGNETLTITIAGTEYTVPVTSGTADFNAHEIETSLEAQVAGWRFDHFEDVVVCQSETTETFTNDFTLVNETGGGTCAGTFVQNSAGQEKTSNWVAQTDWNVNTLTENKPGSFILDPSKLNVYKMEFGYLGAAGIRYYVYHPSEMRWILVHNYYFANQNTQSIFYQPSMRAGWVAASLGSTTNITVKGCSAQASTRGKRVVNARTQAYITSATISNTLVNVLSLRVKKVFGNKPNLGLILPVRIIIADPGSSKGIAVEVFINAAVAGATVHAENSSDSIALLNETQGAITGNGAIESAVLAGGTSIEIDLNDSGFFLLQGEELVIAARSLAGGSPSDDVNISIVWQEVV